MSAEPAFEFVDTNILVYAFDSSAGAKQIAAAKLLERLWADEAGCLSVQVLQEFYVAITRKVSRPLPADEAVERIRELAAWKVFTPTVDDVVAAIGMQKQVKLSFWDALIVQAAAELGCGVLWTEDLADGQRIRGVRIRNPFTLQ